MTQNHSILRHILAEQIDDGSGESLSEDRILNHLTNCNRLTPAEKVLLWTSPVARQRYFQIRRELAERAKLALTQADMECSSQPMAAAGDDDYLEISIGECRLHIMRVPDPETPIILNLQIPEPFLKHVPRGLSVHLHDTGGKTWIIGRPNRHGEIHSGWTDPTRTPMQLIEHHRLVIDLI